MALIFVVFKEKFNLLVICGELAIRNGIDASLIVKRLSSLANGKGGGKKDFAMAGVENFKEREKIENEFFKILNEV